MDRLKAVAFNIVALAVGFGVGMVAISQVIYVHHLQTGAMPLAPLFRGFVVSLIVAAGAPRTGCKIRPATFAGIYLLDIALSLIAVQLAIWLVNSFFDGDGQAAKPWTYGGTVIPFITGWTAWRVLGRYCSRPKAPVDEHERDTGAT